MNNPYTNSKLSIKYFFWMLICLTFATSIIRIFIPIPSNHLKTIIFDAYISPMVFYLWGLYWLSKGLGKNFVPSLTKAFQKPFQSGWSIETLAAFCIGITFSVSAILIFYALLPPSVPTTMTDLQLLKDSSYGNFARLSIFLKCISFAFIAPFIEELIFREAFFKRLKASYSPLKAALFVSAGFSIFQSNFIASFVFSLIGCLLCHKYNSLWPTTLLHILVNTIATLPLLLTLFDGPSTLIPRLEPGYLVYLLSLLLISSIALSIYFYKNKPHYSNESL